MFKVVQTKMCVGKLSVCSNGGCGYTGGTTTTRYAKLASMEYEAADTKVVLKRVDFEKGVPVADDSAKKDDSAKEDEKKDDSAKDDSAKKDDSEKRRLNVIPDKETTKASVPLDWFAITDTYGGDTAPRCPITTCEALKLSETGNTCTATKSDDFGIDSATQAPTHALNVIPGFTKTFCYKCSNGAESQTTKLTFTQETKCKHMLAANTTDLAINKRFNMTMNTTLDYGWKRIDNYDLLSVINSDKPNCPLTTCSIRKPGCTLAYDGARVKVMTNATNNNPDVFYLESKEYDDERFCLRCSNGVQTFDRDDIAVSVARGWTWLTVIIVILAVVFIGTVVGGGFKLKQKGTAEDDGVELGQAD